MCRLYIGLTFGFLEPAFLLLVLFACMYTGEGGMGRVEAMMSGEGGMGRVEAMMSEGPEAAATGCVLGALTASVSGCTACAPAPGHYRQRCFVPCARK